MRRFSAVTGIGLVVFLAGNPLAALGQDATPEPTVVPQAERELAASRQFAGPAHNRGIKSITPLGAVALSDEFPGLDKRQLRARELVIAPGGIVAVHQHDQRPGVAYILDGEIVEHRNDQPTPVVRRPGDVSLEKSGVVHWWENRGTRPVRALVVDIVPVGTK